MYREGRAGQPRRSPREEESVVIRAFIYGKSRVRGYIDNEKRRNCLGFSNCMGQLVYLSCFEGETGACTYSYIYFGHEWQCHEVWVRMEPYPCLCDYSYIYLTLQTTCMPFNSSLGLTHPKYRMHTHHAVYKLYSTLYKYIYTVSQLVSRVLQGKDYMQ